MSQLSLVPNSLRGNSDFLNLQKYLDTGVPSGITFEDLFDLGIKGSSSTAKTILQNPDFEEHHKRLWFSFACYFEEVALELWSNQKRFKTLKQKQMTVLGISQASIALLLWGNSSYRDFISPKQWVGIASSHEPVGQTALSDANFVSQLSPRDLMRIIGSSESLMKRALHQEDTKKQLEMYEPPHQYYYLGQLLRDEVFETFQTTKQRVEGDFLKNTLALRQTS